MELSVGAEVSGERWRQVVGVEAAGGRQVVGAGGKWLVPEASGEQWSRVVDVGAVKHNNLRCHSPDMSNLRNLAGLSGER